MSHTYNFTITDTQTGIKHSIAYATNLLPTQFILLLTEGNLSCDCNLAYLCGIEDSPCGNTRFEVDSSTLALDTTKTASPEPPKSPIPIRNWPF